MADIEINLESSNPKELVAQAVRAYAIGDFTNAAAAFGRATELLAQEHGDFHDPIGEIYIQYAKSLLELSREENVPFGDAIPQGETDSDSEDVEDENKTEENKTEKNETEENKTEENKTDEENKTEVENKVNEEKKIENGEKKDDSKENGITEEEPKKEENGNKTENDEGQENECEENEISEPTEDENCSDLQLAWEILEVAKKIFSNRGDGGKERLAETMILLGEVGMESENFTDGISDMKEGIELQKTIFEPTSRKIAESYYKLGTAQFTLTQTAEAVESFEASIKILKNRIDLLQSQSDDGKTEKEIKAKNDEIDEMKALIPEIEEKINDTKTVKEEMTVQILQEMAGVKPKTDDGAGSSSSSSTDQQSQTQTQTQKAKDISHLVKRKRKADDEPPAENAAKKPTP